MRLSKDGTAHLAWAATGSTDALCFICNKSICGPRVPTADVHLLICFTMSLSPSAPVLAQSMIHFAGLLAQLVEPLHDKALLTAKETLMEMVMRRRWAQRLAGLDFIPAPAEGATSSAGSAAAQDGHVLAGLAEYRQQQRAEAVLEALRSAARTAPRAAA